MGKNIIRQTSDRQSLSSSSPSASLRPARRPPPSVGVRSRAAELAIFVASEVARSLPRSLPRLLQRGGVRRRRREGREAVALLGKCEDGLTDGRGCDGGAVHEDGEI